MTTFSKLLPAIGWFIITLILFTLPGKDLPSASWMEALHVDKAVHIFLFFTLVTLFFWGIVSTKAGIPEKNVLLSIALLSVLYGIAIEFIQKYWIPNRSFDIWDIVADCAGSFLPFLFLKLIKRVFKINTGLVNRL